MLAIGEPLLAALSRENKINESSRIFDVHEVRDARMDVDRLAEEYTRAIDVYRRAMARSIHSLADAPTDRLSARPSFAG